mmetsp:Transcript_96609/g.288430  ORF Transcript_96609/g.288430 Transcript_96609/m.288430 type:complete len:361 (+) Transcript_96609:449-1531(+)
MPQAQQPPSRSGHVGAMPDLDAIGEPRAQPRHNRLPAQPVLFTHRRGAKAQQPRRCVAGELLGILHLEAEAPCVPLCLAVAALQIQEPLPPEGLHASPPLLGYPAAVGAGGVLRVGFLDHALPGLTGSGGDASVAATSLIIARGGSAFQTLDRARNGSMSQPREAPGLLDLHAHGGSLASSSIHTCTSCLGRAISRRRGRPQLFVLQHIWGVVSIKCRRLFLILLLRVPVVLRDRAPPASSASRGRGRGLLLQSCFSFFFFLFFFFLLVLSWCQILDKNAGHAAVYLFLEQVTPRVAMQVVDWHVHLQAGPALAFIAVLFEAVPIKRQRWGTHCVPHPTQVHVVTGEGTYPSLSVVIERS